MLGSDFIKTRIIFFLFILLFAACSPKNLPIDIPVYSITIFESDIDASHFFGGVYMGNELLTIVHREGRQVFTSLRIDGTNYSATKYTFFDDSQESVLLTAGGNNHFWVLKTTSRAHVYQLINLNRNGDVLVSQEIQVVLETEEDVQFTHLVIDGNDNLLLATTDMLYVFDSNANFLFYLGVILIDLGLNSRGIPIIAYFSNLDGDRELREIDVPNRTWGEAHTLENEISGFLRPDRFDILFYNQRGVFGFNYNDIEATLLFTWFELDIPSMDIMFVLPLDGDRLLCVLYSDASTFLYISPDVASSHLERETITLGTYRISHTLFEQILQYNRQNEYFRVLIVDYARYDTEQNPFAGLSMFLNVIKSQETHDLIDFSRLSQREDLFTYMINLYDRFEHSNIDVHGINQTVLELLEVNGELKSIAPYFYVQTAATRNSLWNDIFNVEDFYLKSVSTNIMPFLYLTPEAAVSFFYELIFLNYYDPVTGAFENINKHLSQLFDLFNLLPSDNNEKDRPDILRNGDTFLVFTEIRNFNDIQFYHALLESELLFTGVPTGENFEHIIVFPTTIAISTYASNQELAWEFIEYLLSKEYQNLISIDYFPILNIAMEYKIEREKRLPRYSAIIWDDFSVSLAGANQDDVDLILNLIQTSTRRTKYDIENFERGLASLQAYFAEYRRS